VTALSREAALFHASLRDRQRFVEPSLAFFPFSISGKLRTMNLNPAMNGKGMGAGE
jgi:hypothetical protein